VAGITGGRYQECFVTERYHAVELKGEVYKSVIEPALTYGLEKKVDKRKFDVAEMKMICWMLEIT
jgi:hypothetical protein